MDTIYIPFIKPAGISKYLKTANTVSIKCINWLEFQTCPEVNVSFAHDSKNIALMFRVREYGFRALVTETNGPVYTDSCVELFLSPRSNGYYYNLEFNAIGTVLCGYGKSRENRKPIDPKTLSQIKRHYPAGKPSRASDKEIYWELYISIPGDVFIYDNIDCLHGINAKGNIYKCGDLLPVPHYLSLWPVCTDKPDFHRYDFFRDIIFE